MAKQEEEEVTVSWEGDSLDVLRSFPKGVRGEFGLDIRRVQNGEKPHDSRPMRTVGPGVFELRQRDERGWYRIIYVNRIGPRVFMLHSFMKKTNTTSQKDINTARSRLKNVQARLAEEKKNASKNK